MTQAVLARVSFLLPAGSALFHRTRSARADTAERCERWKQQIAERQTPQRQLELVLPRRLIAGRERWASVHADLTVRQDLHVTPAGQRPARWTPA
jgi:hypothetical protein